MKRLVLDTNVLVSAIVFGGVTETILGYVQTRKVVGVTSPALIEELLRVLRQKFGLPDDMLAVIRRKMSRVFTIVVPQERLAILKDAPDNRVLEAALEGHCDAIITGDKKFLDLAIFREIAILSSRQFYDLYHRDFET